MFDAAVLLLLLGLLAPHASSLTAPLGTRDASSLLQRPHAATPRTMVPLSCPPLLLLQSSEPIITAEGCELLCRYFDRRCKTNEACKLSDHEMCAAEDLLHNVHDVVDAVTNCRRHDGEMQIPRYVRYESALINEKMLLDSKEFGEALLPDGLHCDTNNGKLFRHITAILYLTNNEEGMAANGECFVAGGGTTFPLAVPHAEDRIECDDVELQNAAGSLLERNIHHTKKRVEDEDAAADAKILEKAALDAFFSASSIRFNGQFGSTQQKGLRVMPAAGKLIYFHNVNDNGMPDPLSFHGGEELIDIITADNDPIDLPQAFARTKSILVFFKEVPLESFKDSGREGFAKQVRMARSWTRERYY
ncbi:hypothetical protein ACHAXT_000380 [Thalassiosira profunda]